MLPAITFEETFDKIRTCDRAFKIDFENKQIGEIIDGKDALIQAVRIALMTQRYKYPAFSHSYGTDFEHAFDDGYMMAIGRVENAIRDSLLCDERINAVENFEFKKMGTKIIVKFTLFTVYGSLGYETEVEQ